MSTNNALNLRRIGRGALATLAAVTAASVGTALALNISAGPRSSHALRPYKLHGNPIKAFAVLSHGNAHAAAAGDGVVPAGAILAATVGELSVYVWERAPGERTIGPRTPPATEQMVCESYEIHGAVHGTGDGLGCGPAREIAETGNVTFGQVRIPGTRKLSPMTVTALVPNGVKSVSFTDSDGSSYEVKVTNNVVIVEDEKLAPPPATAVSYKLPDGKTQTFPMPAPEG
jgi:hypothetical protein